MGRLLAVRKSPHKKRDLRQKKYVVTWETQRRSRLEIESGGVWVRVPM